MLVTGVLSRLITALGGSGDVAGVCPVALSCPASNIVGGEKPNCSKPKEWIRPAGLSELPGPNNSPGEADWPLNWLVSPTTPSFFPSGSP